MRYSSTSPTKPWWSYDDADQAAVAAIKQFQQTDREQNHHRMRNLRHLRLYSNRAAASMTGASFSEYSPWSEDHLRRNVAQSIIDAAVSQAAAAKTRAMVLTIDSIPLQNKGKKLQQYIDGQFFNMLNRNLSQKVMQDACTFGTGVVKVYASAHDVRAERVLVDNIVVDDTDAQDGDPRMLFEYLETDKDALAAVYKDCETEIMSANTLRDDNWGRHTLINPVGAVEAWRLPSYPGAGDGRHIICVENKAILYEEWDMPRFPFATVRWKDPHLGWYGTGLAEEVTPHQVEINYTLSKIQRILWLASNSTWVKKGSVSQSDLNNEAGAVRQYAETPPVSLPINTGVAELYQHVRATYEAAFNDTGVSMLQATAQRPVGLNSGEAQRVYNNTASSRFMHVMQRYEQFHVDIAQLLIDAEVELENKGASRTIKTEAKNGLELLKFSDVKMEENQYQLRVFPTSLLPAEPAGKLQTIKELSGVSPELQRSMVYNLDYPDVQSALSEETIGEQIANMVIEKILVDGEYIAPEPFWDLKKCIARAGFMVAKAQLAKYDEDKVQMLRDFVEACYRLMPKPEAPTPLPAAPEQAQPAALPPPPVM